ncbi:ABC transporter substrate-binding protein [Paenibacillus sambharensis]|uniref:ABC transporter substrate-binding protein n=1 Tax=Paenibacillus sambharensis TaxID=1803190 RepID=A0A2W1LCV3_9BACL|nr:extracellular solute-binding protein [Paenibacillus sambharensis]PZD95880.1 ABC transporter substrate-binding protein [Paenibacillus sambharensis]
MKKRMLSIALIAMLVLAGCTEQADRPVTLTFWTTTQSAETEFFANRIAQFQQEHPNIKVEIAEVPFNSATNQFKTAILGNQTIDIFRADNSWIPEYADLGILYPLTAVAGTGDLESYIDSAIRSAQYQGIQYGLPTVMEAPALLYNKRLLKEAGFEQAPQTMEEMLAAAKAVTSKDRYGLFLTDDSYFALPYLWAFGGGTMTDDRQIEIASDNSRQAFEFMISLRQKGVTQPYPDFSDGYNNMMRDFKDGKAAMIINGPWAVSDILSGTEFQNPDNLGIAPVPKGPGGQGSPVGGHSLVVSKYSEHPQESYELIRYLTNTESQLIQSQMLKTLPTQKSAYEDAVLATDPIIQGFKAQLDAAKARPAIPEGAQMFTDFTPNLSAMLLELQTVDEGVRKIEDSWKKLLKIN